MIELIGPPEVGSVQGMAVEFAVTVGVPNVTAPGAAEGSGEVVVPALTSTLGIK